MTSLAILTLAVTIGFSPAQAFEETDIFGQVKWEAAHETSNSTLQKNEQNLTVETKTFLNDDLSLKTIIRGIHETKLEKEKLSQVDLREAYLDLRTDSSKIRLGRQQVVWGKTDGLRLLDLINPQDFREFILDDFIDSRIPLWMARTDLYVGDDTLQILLIPDIKSNKIANSGVRFEPTFLKAIRSIPLSHLEETSPATTLSNMEAGIRYSGFAGGWDYTVNGFYSWEDNPIFFREIINAQPSIILRYKRSKMAGASFSKAFGSFVFRGETAYNMDKFFATTNALHPTGQTKKDEIKAALGVDYSLGDWTLSGQIFESYIIDYESGMVSEENSTVVSFLVNAKFFNDTLDLRLLDIFGTKGSDNLFRFTATYSITDDWKVMGGTSIFSGPDNSFLGQFNYADRVEFELTYLF